MSGRFRLSLIRRPIRCIRLISSVIYLRNDCVIFFFYRIDLISELVMEQCIFARSLLISASFMIVLQAILRNIKTIESILLLIARINVVLINNTQRFSKWIILIVLVINFFCCLWRVELQLHLSLLLNCTLMNWIDRFAKITATVHVGVLNDVYVIPIIFVIFELPLGARCGIITGLEPSL